MANKKSTRMEGYDVVIAGSGPSGCVLAKDLARMGKKVIVLEMGGDSRLFMGSPLAMICGKHSVSTFPKSLMGVLTEDGDEITIGKGVGGGTRLYGGLCFLPDLEMWRRNGIDLEPFLEGAKKETWVEEVPKDFSSGPTRFMSAAYARQGIFLEKAPMLGHRRHDRCKRGCVHCVFGCTRGAKWEGRYTMRDAVEYGATLLTNTKVESAIIENGKAVGFRATRNGSPIEVRAKVAVSSAGGRGSVPIAKRAGIEKAGSWFTGDPCVYTFGYTEEKVSRRKGTGQSSPAMNDIERGCLFLGGGTTAFLLWLPMYLMKEGARALKDIPRHRKMVTTAFKVHDEDGGYVKEDGSLNKIFTRQDEERLKYMKGVNADILIAAGCDPNAIHHSNIILGHPSGTVPIGRLLDVHGQSLDVPNLYFCDASIFPEAPGIPPVLTLATYAKYFANHLLTNVLQ